jgi:hypothetical protein
MYMPYATNITAFESGTNRSLGVREGQNSLAVFYLGGPRSAGYSFVVGFDMSYGFSSLTGGAFALSWTDQPWQRFNDPHPIYETFNITLPQTSNLIDVIGVNTLNPKYQVSTGARQSIAFDTTVIDQPFGWTLIYRDLSKTYINPAQPSPNSFVSNVGSRIPLPLLPLTLGNLNVWSAIMSILLLTASELASPIYARSGSTVFINRKRLRIAALILVVIFLVSTGYQFTYQYQVVPR